VLGVCSDEDFVHSPEQGIPTMLRIVLVSDLVREV
jgi:hypothetical protein